MPRRRTAEAVTRAALAATVLLWTSAAAPQAQNPDLQTLLDSATVQVVDFVNRFSNVVAEEVYV